MRGTRKLQILVLCTVPVLATPGAGRNLTTYGTPGLIEMPTAEVLGDGELAFDATTFSDSARLTLTFQMLPRVYGSFRYGYIGDFFAKRDLYDRSFDVHFQMVEESLRFPGLAVGLRDLGGTGIYGSEYVAATKTFGERLSVTGGLGWGRLASRNGFENPLALIDERFKTRPNAEQVNETGQPDADSWFRGDAAFFGGVRWQVNERLSLLAEYSTDTYVLESERGLIEIDTPVNLGATYQFDNGLHLGGYVIGGTEFGIKLSYVFDPAESAIPGGTGTAPTALAPRDTLAAASWNLPASERSSGTPDVSEVLATRLRDEGMDLLGAEIGARAATIRIRNIRWDAEGQAAGRAARVMANTLPPDVEAFTVVFEQAGVPVTAIRTRRSDLYALEYDLDGAWRSWARAEITDADGEAAGSTLPGAFPRGEWGLSPYLSLSYFDPDNPLRYELGAELFGSFEPAPGLSLSGALRYPLAGTLDDVKRVSNSVLPHVRSDWPIYARESELALNNLTADYLFRPGGDLFARVTAGYLEPMFGGISGELLWYPLQSRLALGAELNVVQQRDYDQLFGFQDYDVVTGHASAYYELDRGYLAQIDAGRYLAGDWGATLSLSREFNNGWAVGGFFTLTDVSAEEFGEGSFDKGIWLTIPLSAVSTKPTRARVQQVIRPILRDGGARVDVRKRLYSVTRDYRGRELRGSWGRYFR